MINRRDILKGAGVAGAAAATGTSGAWWLTGTEFAPGTDENELEDDARKYRNDLEALVGDIDSGEDIDGELDEAIKNVSIPSDAESYEGRGVRLTEEFNVAIPADSQSFDIPREVDGDSVTYTWQEGTGPVNLDKAVDSVRRDMGLSSEGQRIFDEVKEELGDAVLYTATTADGQPDFDESDIDELESVQEQIEGEYNRALERLDELGNVITDSRSFMNQRGSQSFQKSKKLRGVEIWGEEYTGEQITKDETRAMLAGDDPYSEIGVEETYSEAQGEYAEAVMDVARIGLVTELVGQTVADAKGQLDTYGQPDGGKDNGDDGNGGSYDGDHEGFRSEPGCGMDESEIAEETGYSEDKLFYKTEGGDDLEVYFERSDGSLENLGEYGDRC